MEKKKEVITDAMCIAKWQALLKIFGTITDKKPEPEKVRPELEKLKEMAKLANELTPRQVEGICIRCDNYLNGEYGKSKKPEHYSQEHNFSENGKVH